MTVVIKIAHEIIPKNHQPKINYKRQLIKKKKYNHLFYLIQTILRQSNKYLNIKLHMVQAIMTLKLNSSD